MFFTNLMESDTPETLEGYKYARKISDQHTKWTEIFLLKSKGDVRGRFQSFIQSVVILATSVSSI